MNPNDETIQTYQKNFDTYIEKTPKIVDGEFKEWIDAFLEKLPAKPHIFEMGSAFGRDAAYLREKGARVFCTDIIPQALEQLTKEGFETAYYDFRDKPKEEWLGNFDGFFANAVLLHASQEIFEQALSTILEILKPGGIAALSVKSGEGEEMSIIKLGAPRFFRYHSLDTMKEILARYPVEIQRIKTRESEKWIEVIFKKA